MEPSKWKRAITSSNTYKLSAFNNVPDGTLFELCGSLWEIK